MAIKSSKAITIPQPVKNAKLETNNNWANEWLKSNPEDSISSAKTATEQLLGPAPVKPEVYGVKNAIGDIGEAYNTDGWLGAIGQTLGSLGKYSQTAQGKQLQAILAGNAGNEELASQYLGEAKTQEAEDLAAQQAYKSALQKRGETSADLFKTLSGEETQKALKGAEHIGTEELKGMEQEFTAGENVKNRVQEAEKIKLEKEKLAQADRFKRIDQDLEAGKFDETQRQDLIKLVAQKDPNLALQLNGMTAQEIQMAKIEKPGFFDQIGSLITTARMSTPKVSSITPSGTSMAGTKGSPQYQAAMEKKGLNTARK